jgi:hypothetical protein
MKLNMSSFQSCRFIKLLAVCLIALGAILSLATAVSAEAAPNALEIRVYRNPSCSCCGAWMAHLTDIGFQTKNVPTPDMSTLKEQYGVPDNLASCHTAVINGYIIEGHVPAEDIKRLLAEQSNVAGIAVPGMPIGTPGMESGEVREPFTVFSFNKQGNAEVFNQYSF